MKKAINIYLNTWHNGNVIMKSVSHKQSNMTCAVLFYKLILWQDNAPNIYIIYKWYRIDSRAHIPKHSFVKLRNPNIAIYTKYSHNDLT